ncbi:MAG: RNA 2'-phosphotransferase [Jatrophihabitans sp.]
MNQARTSKFLSLVLRHRPDKIGVALDPAGWVKVNELLAALAKCGQPLTRAELDAVVAESDKQRFVIDRSADRIRANQGHSIEVDLGLSEATPPAVLYHGTPTRNLDSIFAEGLCKQARHAVHLSLDVETAHRVGARRGGHVVVRVDASAMHEDGHRFAVSANGVWLTDAVPARYLSVHAGTQT